MKNQPNNYSSTRILIFHPSLPPYRLSFFNALSELFCLRLVFLFENLLEQELNQKELSKEFFADHQYLLNGFTVFNRTFRFGVRKQIFEFRPDIIITSEFSFTTLFAAIIKRLYGYNFKHILWIDDNPESILCESIVRVFARKLLLPLIDGLILLSSESEKLYKNKFKTKVPIGIVPILHNDNDFRNKLDRSKNKAAQLIQAYKLNQKKIFLYVGRLAKEKRVDRIIHAFSSICFQKPDSVLVIVGSGKEEQSLKELSRNYKLSTRIIFTGMREGTALYAWYRIGCLFLLTSDYDPFGAVINEALLSGMPVVCSEKAGARVLIKKGVNGTVVDPSDESELKDAMLTWIGNVEPISEKYLNSIRPSMMFIRFEHIVSEMVQLFEKVNTSS